VAASTCGCCNPLAANPAIRHWDATAVWIDRAMPLLANLPLILDDTKKCTDPKRIIPHVIYAVTSNQGRGRGSPTGTQTTGRWNTVLLSTGESKITEFTEEAGGAHMRAVCLWGSPFGGTSLDLAHLVNRIEAGVYENYGHALPRLLRYVMQHKGDWKQWRAWKEESRQAYVAQYLEETGGENVQHAHRISEYAAILQTVATIVHAAMPMPWETPDMWKALRTALHGGMEGADQASEALAYLYDDAVARQSEYWDGSSRSTLGYGPTEGGSPRPGVRWRGRWDRQTPAWDAITFTKDTANEVLGRFGIGWKTAVRWWNDRGWIERDVKNNSSYAVAYIAGQTARHIVIKRAAIESIGGGGDGEPAKS
jgi:putative DNA primase/helicase